ncbi:Possible regulator pra-like protein [[Actinomadura] parvosata subsp. kistnae]|uniref:Plasmid replication, integration and excision activator n=1 Tax=[Actinomadura] parvosata subsp. kistnae TaxID=1909395 RepID=A0A1V0ACA7_9ACTN|nr:plasmid replication, integration and excision activator [Nonomuraea sp. ATCC 55076]AQZ67762.1 plasmid replication, integration and excision activator [Nonomuraea sp. ATCC 55076]SPL93937.1 Possible regulator pra-like protein [Actinomadura parvosata subsp. kistnae]
MAIQGPIPVTFAQVFPHGCYTVGEIEPVKDFEASTNGRFVQARDKQTGELVWQIPVMDADPSLKAAQKTVAVKILSPTQPVAPAPVAGLPFTPVEFDGMTVTPYVNGSGRLAYSIKARQMLAPRTNTTKSNGSKEVAA